MKNFEYIIIIIGFIFIGNFLLDYIIRFNENKNYIFLIIPYYICCFSVGNYFFKLIINIFFKEN
jgi:hypothetical protein